MRYFFVLVALLSSRPIAAQASSPIDILARNAGYETAAQIREENSEFSFARFQEGFDLVIRGDSSEIAFALGLRAGLGLYADTVSAINPAVFLNGFRDGLSGVRAPYSQQEIAAATAAYQDSLQIRQVRARARTSPEARAEFARIRANGDAARRFLAGVERRPGVRKTASGLLYIITTPGRGASTTATNLVRIRYVGRLADGTEFDRSPPGETVELPVYAVVPGFAEALQLMKPGETRTIWLPPNLGYGMAGAPGPDGQSGIPMNSALEFDVTLFEAWDDSM